VRKGTLKNWLCLKLDRFNYRIPKEIVSLCDLCAWFISVKFFVGP